MDIYLNSMTSISLSCNYHTHPFRSIFESPSEWYESYQVNGTRYLRSRKKLENELQLQLNTGAGEIFIGGICSKTRPETLAEVASIVGEVYILRFKLNMYGGSRGIAYLQYMDPSLMHCAVARLPGLYRQHGMYNLRITVSLNSSKLLLKKTYGMSPSCVIATIRNIISFCHIVGREIVPGYFEYQIIFQCNDRAARARRDLIRNIKKFGRKAFVMWDTSRYPCNHHNHSWNSTHHSIRPVMHNSMAMIWRTESVTGCMASINVPLGRHEFAYQMPSEFNMF